MTSDLGGEPESPTLGLDAPGPLGSLRRSGRFSPACQGRCAVALQGLRGAPEACGTGDHAALAWRWERWKAELFAVGLKGPGDTPSFWGGFGPLSTLEAVTDR